MNKTKLLFRDAFLCLLLSLVFLWGVSNLILNLSIFNPFTGAFKDFSFLDLYYSERMEKKEPLKDIVIVNIEQRDRFEINELLQHIKAQQPKVIGLDIIFAEEREPFIDSLLAQSFSEDNVILSKAFITDHWVKNAPIFNQSKNELGYSNLNFDRKNNVIRTFEGIKTIDNTKEYSFSTLVAKAFKNDPEYNQRLDKKLKKATPISYHGTQDDFFTLSYEECMEQESIPFLKDKIVLLGYLGTPHGSEYDIEDKFFTPLNKGLVGKSAPDMFGVLIHANIINMLLHEEFITTVPFGLILLISSVLTFFFLAIFMVSSTKNPASYTLSKKITQLLFTVLLLWLSLWLYKHHILFKPEVIISIVVVSVDLIGLYKIIANYFNKKYTWKSYFFQ